MVVQVATPERTELRVVDRDGISVSAPAADVEGGDQTNPDWSPDGARLTFGMTADDGRDDLWVVGVDGAAPTMLFDCADDCAWIDDPAWSPDGSSIAVCLMRSIADADVGSLALVDVETGALGELAAFEPNDFCAGPRWSPDGGSLVLELVHRAGPTNADDVTGVTLSVVSAETGELVQALTDPALFAATADWNPVTGEIVYSALATPDAERPGLFGVLPDGTGLRPLTDLAAEAAATEPSVSADGSTVVFVSDGPTGLLQVDADSLEVEPAFASPLIARHPRHRPASAG